MLEDKRVNKLKHLIKDSFRVRPNQDPLYIEVEDHLERLKAPQHQVLFGRRGSGKSCLLVHFKKLQSQNKDSLLIYIESDEIKRLGYPDVLIRLLLSIMENTPSAREWWKRWIFKNSIHKHIVTLRQLLKQAESRKVKQEESETTTVNVEASKSMLKGNMGKSSTFGLMSEFEENKLDYLERYISDFKQALVDELKKKKIKIGYVMIDDFYLIKREKQPDVIDYLHRLLRGTDLFLKVGTIRHRTSLVKYQEQTIGVVEEQDIEVINLDRTLEDLTTPTQFLSSILNSMGEKVGIVNASQILFNSNSLEKLVIASGGVPRDFLTIFVNALDNAVSTRNFRHLTQTNIWKAASSNSYRNKLQNLRTDTSTDSILIERVFRSLLNFCLQEKRKTCFLISQDEAQQFPNMRELILQLMDSKLIHVVEADTSAASGRTGRYEAYTLDFSLFMEPRKRNIEIIEFWKYDNGGRRIGVRESPVYPLSLAYEASQVTDNQTTENVIDLIENE